MIVPEEKSIFNTYSQDLRYLYQLRVGLSPLRAHKHRHNFLDTPSDICTCNSGVETTVHYLLYCPLFVTHREELMEIVQPILNSTPNVDDLVMSHILLYGKKALNPTQNREILNATLDYIRNTGRFSFDSES